MIYTLTINSLYLRLLVIFALWHCFIMIKFLSDSFQMIVNDS